MLSIESVLSNPIVAQFLGLLVGLLTSFFSWWVLFHWISPKIEVSANVVRQPALAYGSAPSDASGFRYNFKLRNVGRRAIIDLQVRALVRIRGVVDPEALSWEVIHLPMTMSGDRVYSLSRIEPYSESKLLTILRLYTHDLQECFYEPFPPHIRQLAADGRLSLDDLLAFRKVAVVRIFVSGYDSFSGARKVFVFTIDKSKVIPGRFVKNSMKVDQNPLPMIAGPPATDEVVNNPE